MLNCKKTWAVSKVNLFSPQRTFCTQRLIFCYSRTWSLLERPFAWINGLPGSSARMASPQGIQAVERSTVNIFCVTYFSCSSSGTRFAYATRTWWQKGHLWSIWGVGNKGKDDCLYVILFFIHLFTFKCIQLQSVVRCFLSRLRYQRTLAHYHANIDKVVKVQNFIRNKILGNAYRKLSKLLGSWIGKIFSQVLIVSVIVTDSNPSIGTVKNFIHLLDDSDLDFDMELGKKNKNHCW